MSHLHPVSIAALLLSLVCSFGLAAGTAGAELTTEVKQITFGPRHHFFGYFGHARTIPWNESGRFIVALRTSFQDRMPKPDDAADIVLLDSMDCYKERVVDQTRAWNF